MLHSQASAGFSAKPGMESCTLRPSDEVKASSTSGTDRAGSREIRELGLHRIDGRSQHVADAGDFEDSVGQPVDRGHYGGDHPGNGLSLIRRQLPNQVADFIDLSFGGL